MLAKSHRKRYLFATTQIPLEPCTKLGDEFHDLMVLLTESSASKNSLLLYMMRVNDLIKF
ncbi:hypothetical protein T05_3146 [Trichinella murrelli]|uniref:Uncharacterized protein n=1 Tax=Trichinella murrelli TaxID=144512 RepID=A0A0V0TIW5_9BILA|nr:hypothetical protein T05_3146 [Trichinella murrelli]